MDYKSVSNLDYALLTVSICIIAVFIVGLVELYKPIETEGKAKLVFVQLIGLLLWVIPVFIQNTTLQAIGFITAFLAHAVCMFASFGALSTNKTIKNYVGYYAFYVVYNLLASFGIIAFASQK